MVTYADKPWLKHYDPGIPASLQPYPEIPLFRFLTDAAAKTPNRAALISSARLPVLGRLARYTSYAELNRMTDALAAALVEMGLKKGDRVALILPNTVQFAVAFYGVLKAGGVVAACNPAYPAEKMAFQINDCNAQFVITLSLFYGMMKQIQPRTQVKRVIVTNIKEYLPPVAALLFTLTREQKDGHRIERLEPGDLLWQDVLAKYDGRKSDVEVKAADAAIFQYTGGTTGVSKGAMSTHQALVCNMLQARAWLFPDNAPELKALMENNFVTLGAIPMFHAYGMVIALSLTFTLGGTVALVPNARLIDDVVDVIATFKPNGFSGVPALFNAVNNHPRVQSGEVDLKMFKICSSGSAPLPPAVKRDFEKLSGVSLPEGFGMSEAPTASHFNPIKGRQKLNSVGLPLPDMEMKIVSLDDGVTDVPVGTPGELLMTGPNLMLGYHNMPTETANTLRRLDDGKLWLYTGDIAIMDEEGYFFIVDRKKDMALIGGFNVYPANIERALKDHPAVLECAVAGVPHPDADKAGQETLKAWVVLKPGAQATEKELSEHCAKFLAPYEVPRRFAFLDALPKTEVLKTLRRELVRLEMEAQEKGQAHA